MKTLRSPFFVFSLLFIFLLFFLPPTDSDFGWHFRYGQYFMETGMFLRENMLTYYLPGYIWSNSYGLYQIFTFNIYKLLGFFGLSLANSILFVFSFIFFYKINPKLSKTNLILFLLIIIFGWNVLGIGFRAQEFSFFFLILELFLLKKSEENFKYLLFLIPLFIFWVNIHGAFILGVIMLSAYLFNLVINNFKKVYSALALLIVSVLATFINPYGINVYSEDIRHISTPMKLLIAEWLEPTLIFKLLILGLFFLCIYIAFKAKDKSKLFWIILLTLFSYLAFTARRNLPFFALITSLSLINFKKDIFEKFENSVLSKKITVPVLLIFILFLLGFQIPKTFDISSNWQSYCTKGILPYPCKAVDFIKKNNFQGVNVFSSYEWGGFLEWQLPNYKFFVDGRTPAWKTPEGKSPYTVYLEIIQSQPGYQKRLEKYQTDWLLIGANTFLDFELQKNINTPWTEIYRDNISVIYTPKH
ncbi:hypothetical protein A2V55_00040 [Candidatus Woesebacteria bacterium RBG_19FT_COMBO_37_29]|uniref:Glycosyltransferase RgtA/B/C/D-like domain-containing protein n=1 Tax=Candidatus Woesebacteria bacterium RBG_19FT_COMBO_37_29 TaxID=1802486 RepID=A0A1F7XND4_9BACT|nr:MAG: hypothetical protein A2V55_00040 [Candidatus Woesebacteria bacterium RBG_19FT_COMBO_37_29]